MEDDMMNQEYKEMFDSYDIDQSGHISGPAMLELFHKIGKPAPMAQDEEISYPHFLQLLAEGDEKASRAESTSKAPSKKNMKMQDFLQ